MQSTNIVAIRGDGLFGVPIICENMSFALKFDTGACETVISIEKILGKITDEQRAKIKEYILSENATSKDFRSASGDSFVGYATNIKNVFIGQCKFECFYYYLVIDKMKDDKQIALLGDNFIDCSDFSHKSHGNIVITGFDFDSYGISSNCLSTDEILDLITI